MADLKTLREQMARIANEARSKLSEATDKTNEARAAEIEREFDAMMADHDRIGGIVQRMEKVDAAVRAASGVDLSKRPVAERTSVPAVDDGAKVDYRTAFYAMIANGGVDGLDGEHRAVLQQAEARAQTAGTNSAGGYTVPVELASFIEKAMIASGPMYDSNLFTVINTTGGNTFNIPTVNDTAVTAVAHTEGGSVTDDGSKDVTFGQAQLGAYAFDTAWVRWSYELANDSILNVESLLGELLGERLGRIANSKLTTGSGSSDVEGIVTNSTLGKTAAAVAAITADEIIDLIHSVDPAYRSSPSTAIMMNDSTLAAVRKLKDGQGNYLWQMGNYQAGVPQNILGYNVVVNQAMASLATGAKVMLFGDMSKFYVRKVGAPTLFVARERFAPDYGILGYARFDGVLANTAAIKHLKNA
ncbi:COG4653 Predicted phage phi-C31 gp36 major capsid-like protein [uncultured Caudovirales phage]|uniref:COG4653 Predicted phage phi-C31 gp36 major capsid-like protein n=1 Tax=uncultured Caudovirales phage TaxID=2100421 RepID=A0A6J5MY79_9CAUD|nr:COG4653 Predicted phage phi-C31 gp36 major capsid-like protein [uncultured Caudovirales phage]